MNFPPHVQELLEKRYFLKGEPFKNYYGHDGTENWELLCNRVANTVSKNNPDMRIPYFKMIHDLEFLPNSPTLFGAGVPGLCLSACFIAPMEDSIEGWANTFRAAMKIQTAGGGIGFALHKLRPSGSPVRGKIAHAAGPIEFMKCWNQISKSFRQAVRNGANMGQLIVSHPDVEEFITCKDKDGELSAFNVSVMITDEFMECVKKKTTFNLTWNGKVYKTVDAVTLWNKICDHAWKTGEPGVIFYDKFQSSFNHDEEVYGNPCLHGDTLIHTKEYGLVKIGVMPRLKVSTFDHESNQVDISKTWKSGNKECVKITLQNGREIICTPDHKFLTKDGKWEDSSTLLNKELKRVYGCEWDGVIPKEYQHHDMTILGFIFGDGCYHKASNRVKYVYIGEKDYDVETHFKESEHASSFNFEERQRSGVPIANGFCNNLFTEPLPERPLPDFVKHLPKMEMCKFLKGLYSANGYVINDYGKNRRICIKMTNKKLILEIQELLSILDIDSKIQINHGKPVTFDNGEYLCKDSHTLIISEKQSCVNFQEHIGFLQLYKNLRMSEMIEELPTSKTPYPFTKVISIEPVGVHTVYDFTQPESHCGSLAGIVTHNCAEYTGPMNGACNLGSINLLSCATDIVNCKFDYSKFEEIICNAYTFLDDLIDINQYPTPEIDQKVKDYRQIGLGTMGFADVLVRFGIVYGSKESHKLANDIFDFKDNVEKRMNSELASTRGAYPKCPKEKMLRNANTSTQAPTGSISMIAGVSASIEPIFSFEPITRIIDGVKKEIFSPVKHKDPKVNVNANQLGWLEHIETAGEIQKYVNMSISKTINLPNSALVEDVKNAFHYAFIYNLKGVTVYRDGCRANQTIQTEATKTIYDGGKKTPNLTWFPELDKITPVKRSGILSGRTFKDKIACGNLYTTINFDSNGNMLEVFVRPGKQGGCGSNVEAIARLLSMSLRSGVKVSEIVDQLKGIRCPACMSKKDQLKFTSCSDSIAKAIEYATKHKEDINIIKEKVKEIEEELQLETSGIKSFKMKCPDCKSVIALEAGCQSCKNCGWSKCG